MIAPVTDSALLVVTQRLPPDPTAIAPELPLTAEERCRSRYQLALPDGRAVRLHLPRGSEIRDRDLLRAETGEVLRAIAALEPVLTVRGAPHALARAAYHLGNRHVPLEVAPDYLRLSPDPVLRDLLERLGLAIATERAPFFPEPGAYATHTH